MTEWSQLSAKMSDLMRRGVGAFDEGDRLTAHRLFSEAAEQEEDNELVILWRAATAPSLQETLASLERVLEIDPTNRFARQGLAWTRERLGVDGAPAEAPPDEPWEREAGPGAGKEVSVEEARVELDALIEGSEEGRWVPEQPAEELAPWNGIVDAQPEAAQPVGEEELPTEGEAPGGVESRVAPEAEMRMPETAAELETAPEVVEEGSAEQATPGEVMRSEVGEPAEWPTMDESSSEPTAPDEEEEDQPEAIHEGEDVAEWIASLGDEGEDEPAGAEPVGEAAPPEAKGAIPSWLEEALVSSEKDAADWSKLAPEPEERAATSDQEDGAGLHAAEQAEAHYRRGVSLFEENKLQESVAELREAISLRPEHADAHNYAGNSLYMLGETEQAIGEYSEAIRIEPNHQDAHLNLGIVLKNENRKEEAARELRRFLELDPESSIRSEVENLIQECES